MLVASLLVPGVGVLAGLIAPTPLIIISLQKGRYAGLSLIALVFVVLTALMGPRQAVLFFAEYALLAIVMAEGIRYRFDFDKCILFSALGSAVLSLAFVFAVVADSEKTVTEFFQSQVEMHFQSTMENLKAMGEAESNLEAMRQLSERVSLVFAQSYPAFILVGSLIVAAVNFALVRVLWIRIYGASLFSGVSFAQWVLPDTVIWAFILSGTTIFLGQGAIGVVGMNVFVVVLVIYFFQGMAILQHFLENRNVPLIFRVVLLLLILIQPLFMGLVVGLGVFDLWVDFRKLKPQPEDTD